MARNAISGKMSGQTVLVTGATRGIGYASAVALASQGAHVIALGRTQGGLEDLDDAVSALGGTISLVPMDIKDSDAIDRLAGVVAERWGCLDGLFANAGVLGEITPVAHTAPDIVDNVMAVNFNANFRLIRAFDPLLRNSEQGRALFVTSGAAQSRKAYWGIYAASKSALDAMVQSYAREVAMTALKVNLLDPGAVRTAMRAKAIPGEDPATLPDPHDVASYVVELLSSANHANGEIFTFRKSAFYKAASTA